MQYKDLALTHSANCFYNSLVRDFNLHVDSAHLHFEDFRIPVKHYSHVGAHSYESSDFYKILDLICGESLLKNRVLNSIHNIELFLEKSKNRFSIDHFNFLSTEQDLLIGHSFHPCPKSRDEFTDLDLERFAPELAAKFPLRWFFVKKDLIHSETAKSFNDYNWMFDLFKNEVPDGFVPYPVHPWQYNKLINDSEIIKYLETKNMMPADGADTIWHATSSMRSLYNPEYKYMIKFSMSVKMTNSIRHLQPKEVSRGMMIKDTFELPFMRKFKEDFPQFEIMHEPYFCAIKGSDESLLAQTMVLLRENLIQDDEAVMLATLNQPHPYSEENMLARVIHKSELTPQAWFDQFIEKAILPLIYLQADYGVYLGAHQQNLIIKLENGKPVGSIFRDCQGTGLGTLATQNIAKDMSDHAVSTEAGIHLFTYYLVINSIFNSIAAISVSTSIDEKVFIRILNKHLQKMKASVKDSSVIDHLLHSKELTQKGNLRCNLSNINENTTENPLSIYNSFPNPLVNI